MMEDDNLQVSETNNCVKILCDWEADIDQLLFKLFCFIVHAIHLLGLAVELSSIGRSPDLDSQTETIKEKKYSMN